MGSAIKIYPNMCGLLIWYTVPPPHLYFCKLYYLARLSKYTSMTLGKSDILKLE